MRQLGSENVIPILGAPETHWGQKGHWPAHSSSCCSVTQSCLTLQAHGLEPTRPSTGLTQGRGNLTYLLNLYTEQTARQIDKEAHIANENRWLILNRYNNFIISDPCK